MSVNSEFEIKMKAMIEELIDLSRKRDEVFFKLVKILLTQIQIAAEMEVRLETTVIIDILEDSIAEYRRATNLPSLS
ncbi:MAG TPA: hypothetical protein VNX68_06350 [Nitrosopumilaceae archaeon]|jgi:hypothetical protein|nr:hypothetical protein [Nitrosopumilaceae archaeon]